MTLRDILADIHALEEDLLAFERNYGVRSETFYAAYISGEEPEDEGWVLDFEQFPSVRRSTLIRIPALEMSCTRSKLPILIRELEEVIKNIDREIGPGKA